MRTIIRVTLIMVLVVPSFAAAQGTVQWTLDRDATLVSKDVGPERWAITYRISDGRVTGNVFRSDGGPSSFLQCDRTGGDPAGFVFDCYGASACTGTPCPGSQYSLIASGVTLPQSFFFPPGDAPPAGAFVEGTYTNADFGVSCTLVSAAFGARAEYVLTCTEQLEDRTETASIVWYTGPIQGNPLEGELVESELDKIPGNDQFAWGRVAMETAGQRGFARCFRAGSLISARQTQNALNLADYFNDGDFDCGLTLVQAGF